MPLDVDLVKDKPYPLVSPGNGDLVVADGPYVVVPGVVGRGQGARLGVEGLATGET